MLWKYCGRSIFFNSSLDFSNHYFILFFFLPFSAIPLPQLLTFFFYSPISAMALPQLGSHNFFFSLFRQCHCHNYFATIFFFLPILAMALPQLGSHKFFFLPISAMALPQLVCNNFFFPYFGNTIATISLSQIFLTNNN